MSDSGNNFPKDRQENIFVLLTGFFGIVTVITTMFLQYYGRINVSEFLCFSLFGFAALIFGLVKMKKRRE